MLDAPHGSWHEKDVTLRYKAGDVVLKTFALPFLELNLHFTELGTDPATHRPPFPLPDDRTGALVRSHPVEQDLPQISKTGDFLLYVPRTYPRHYIEMKNYASFEDYMKKFSGKTRSTLNRRVKKWAEHCGGKIDFREFRTPDEIEEFHKLAAPLSDRTYQTRLLDSGLPNTPEFIAAARKRAADDAIRAYLLSHDGKPVAYLYTPIHLGKILEYEFLGYDPEFSNWSVGTVLQHLALEKLYAEKRYECFDFTEGGGDHKKLFSTAHVQCADLWYFKPTLKNQAIVHGHVNLGKATAQLRALAEKYEVKQKLKNLIRRGKA